MKIWLFAGETLGKRVLVTSSGPIGTLNITSERHAADFQFEILVTAAVAA